MEEREDVFHYDKSAELYPEGHERPEDDAGAEAGQEPGDRIVYPSLQEGYGGMVLRDKRTGEPRRQRGYDRPGGLQDFLQLHPSASEDVVFDLRGMPLSVQDIEAIAERIVDGTAVPADFTMRPEDTGKLEKLLQERGFKRDDEGLLAEPGSGQEKWLEEEEPEP